MTMAKKNIARGCVLLLLAAPAAACSNLNTQQERALTGGALGAAGGAVIGALTGGWVVGAIVGGVAGAAVGAFTTPSQVHVGR
jgi:uncharacterized membrane protein